MQEPGIFWSPIYRCWVTRRTQRRSHDFRVVQRIEHAVQFLARCGDQQFEGHNSALAIHRLDVASLFSQAIANPAAFGLTNVTDSAAPGLGPAIARTIRQIVSEPKPYYSGTICTRR